MSKKRLDLSTNQNDDPNTPTRMQSEEYQRVKAARIDRGELRSIATQLDMNSDAESVDSGVAAPGSLVSHGVDAAINENNDDDISTIYGNGSDAGSTRALSLASIDPDNKNPYSDEEDDGSSFVSGIPGGTATYNPDDDDNSIASVDEVPSNIGVNTVIDFAEIANAIRDRHGLFGVSSDSVAYGNASETSYDGYAPSTPEYVPPSPVYVLSTPVHATVISSQVNNSAVTGGESSFMSGVTDLGYLPMDDESDASIESNSVISGDDEDGDISFVTQDALSWNAEHDDGDVSVMSEDAWFWNAADEEDELAEGQEVQDDDSSINNAIFTVWGDVQFFNPLLNNSFGDETTLATVESMEPLGDNNHH